MFIVGIFGEDGWKKLVGKIHEGTTVSAIKLMQVVDVYMHL